MDPGGCHPAGITRRRSDAGGRHDRPSQPFGRPGPSPEQLARWNPWHEFTGTFAQRLVEGWNNGPVHPLWSVFFLLMIAAAIAACLDRRWRPLALATLIAAALLTAKLNRTALVDGNTLFAVDLYRREASQPDTNIFFSPYSISTAMAMVDAGARGATATEIEKAMLEP